MGNWLAFWVRKGAKALTTGTVVATVTHLTHNPTLGVAAGAIWHVLQDTILAKVGGVAPHQT